MKQIIWSRRTLLLLAMLVAGGVGVLIGGGAAVRAASGTDASVKDYSQCANDSPTSTKSTLDPTDCVPQGWIFGILNANNSQYHEDQVTAQRLLVAVPKGGPATGRIITIKYLTRKGQGGVGNHAYDSLALWNYTQANADRCQGINPSSACPGGTVDYHLIPSDSTKVADSVTGAGTNSGSPTSGHELADAGSGCDGSGNCGTSSGPRRMAMFGGTITSITAPVHDNADGSGDDYASVTITYSVPDTTVDRNVELLFGGHLAASGGSRGWGSTVGASFINGGPYHIKLDGLDGTSGSKDNQITSGAILPIPTGVTTSLTETDSGGSAVSGGATGANISVLPGAYAKDTATVSPSGSTGTVSFRYYFSATSLAAAQSACTADTNFTSGAAAGTNIGLSGDTATSDNVGALVVGWYVWRAVFTGTGLSLSSDSGCTSEAVTVAKTTPTASSTPKVVPQDSVTLGNLSGAAGGTVTFDLYAAGDASCSGNAVFEQTVTVSGNGSYPTTNDGTPDANTINGYTITGAGTYKWKVHYTGDATNNSKDIACGVESVTVGFTS